MLGEGNNWRCPAIALSFSRFCLNILRELMKGKAERYCCPFNTYLNKNATPAGTRGVISLYLFALYSQQSQGFKEYTK
jgi:hypothetical protein